MTGTAAVRNDSNDSVLHMTMNPVDLSMDWTGLFGPDPADGSDDMPKDTVPDALVRSLTTFGRVDMEYIARISGTDCKEAIGILRGAVFQNPETWEGKLERGWETADEYLSGNILQKLRVAKEANITHKGYFNDNVIALRQVLPASVSSDDIYVTLGSPWLPTDIIDDFLQHLFGSYYLRDQYLWERSSARRRAKEDNPKGKDRKEREAELLGRTGRWWLLHYAVKHDEVTGTWEIPSDTKRTYKASDSIGVYRTWGITRMGALHIIERTLNMKPVIVTDEIQTGPGKKDVKRVINREETAAAQQRQQKLFEEFQDWIWKDESRRDRLVQIFEERFGSRRCRTFDGSYLTFPGMSPDISLYSYQKNAVARILYSPNTLLAHDVGAGKTYIMIAAGQELLRMGLSRKNMYVVPNNITGQWQHIFQTMYPDADILVVDPKSFVPKKRREMLRRIQEESCSNIIIAYSCFGQIAMSKRSRIAELKEQETQILDAQKKQGKDTKNLKKKLEAVQQELSMLSESPDDKNDQVYFDQLGITRLFVDEAHNYKNVSVKTKARNVPGISESGSSKCRDMMDKVRYVQKCNGGKGVIMATGTPITNSITDVFVMQQYLQSGELTMLELQNFDSWIGMFAERVTDFEVDVDTSGFRMMTRFSRFHNLPELTALLSGIADFHEAGGTDDIPETDGYQDVMVYKQKALSKYLQEISDRADAVRHGQVKRTEDNMLKITTDGRKAALDIRLVQKDAPGSLHDKVSMCAEKVADIYYHTMGKKSAQLVFCDISVPGKGFNIYDELKKQLVNMGLYSHEIAFIHDASTEAERQKLFARVRSGEIRVLVGSTLKLGLGVNIQDRLIALHHLDVPWRPADMVQREGRILRQGNCNPKVFIYRYITEGSFDAYSWQLLETKQRFITELLSGFVSQRSASDIENTVLGYAEVKALAIGNPLVKERVEAANELSRYRMLQRKLVDSRQQMQAELFQIPGQIRDCEQRIEDCQKDIRRFRRALEETAGQSAEQDKLQRELARDLLHEGLKEHVLEPGEVTLFTYRGFDIVLPAGMPKDKPYIYLEGTGRYIVELGDSPAGNLTRIDNCLKDLDKRLLALKEKLSLTQKRKDDLFSELASSEDYSDQIRQFEQKVEDLDRKLGIGDLRETP